MPGHRRAAECALASILSDSRAGRHPAATHVARSSPGPLLVLWSVPRKRRLVGVAPGRGSSGANAERSESANIWIGSASRQFTELGIRSR